MGYFGSAFYGIFVTFLYQNTHNYRVACLALPPLKDENTHDKGKHDTFLQFFLQVYEKEER